MAEYSPDYLRRLDAAIDRFLDAFEDWMETQNEATLLESRGLFPTAATKEGQNIEELRALELEVAEAAGLAARAVAVTGAHIRVQGLGAIDPISNWSMMSSPKAVIAPHDVRMVVANVKGRLEAMIGEAEAASGSSSPGFSPANFHTLVWSAAAENWTIHQYRIAVREAAEALTVHWKNKLGRNDVDDTSFWQQTLSPGEASSGRPKLIWPGNPEDKTVKSMRGGVEPLARALSFLASGLNLTVRNTTTHTRDELTEQEAMERLAAYSYLAHVLDQCEIVSGRGSESA